MFQWLTFSLLPLTAAPCVFHEFEGPTALAYDVVGLFGSSENVLYTDIIHTSSQEGTDKGNAYKKEKLLKAYDDDAKATIDLLESLPNCNGRISATGMCLGGHLAFRVSFLP